MGYYNIMEMDNRLFGIELEFINNVYTAAFTSENVLLGK